MRGRSAALDGLRGLAALAVVGVHAEWLPGGWVGVPVFFVLSGWLIAGITEHAEYVWRRAVRILPSALVVLVLTCALAGHWEWAWQGPARGYVQVRTPVEHYWTLAVECAWYALAPLAVPVLRRHRASSGIVIAAAWVASAALRSVLLVRWTTFGVEWHLPLILAGAWCRVHDARGSWWSALIGAVAVCVVCLLPFEGWQVVPSEAGALVLVLGAAHGHVPLAWARRLGDLSYPLYLVHLPILTLASGPMWARVAASSVAAFALWWTLDRHCTRGLAGLRVTRRAVLA